ncbi:unnamed protein product [Ectocarpus sp. 4 AP-2014]
MASIATRTRSQLGREVQACGDTSTNRRVGTIFGDRFFKYFGEANGHQPSGWHYCFGGSRVEQCGPFRSLDLAKTHAAEAMNGIAADPSTEFGTKRPRGAENEATTTKANDATFGGGSGGGSGGIGSGSGDGSGGGSAGNTAADRIDVELSYVLLSMRSGRAGEGSGASPPTEQDDLLSTWSMAAPAVFASLVSAKPERDTTAELLELIGESGDSDDLLDAVFFGSSPPPQTISSEDRNLMDVQRETMSASSDVVPGVTDPDPQGALEEGGGNPYGISAEMLEVCSGKILNCGAAGSSTASPAAATTTSSSMAITVAFPDGDKTLVDWKSFF